MKYSDINNKSFIAKADDVDAIRSYFRNNFKKQDIELPVVIRDLNLPDENKRRLEAQIQETIKSEIASYSQLHCKMLAPSPESAAARSPEPAAARSPEPAAHTSFSISLKDLSIPDENRRRLETQIQEMIKSEIARYPQSKN